MHRKVYLYPGGRLSSSNPTLSISLPTQGGGSGEDHRSTSVPTRLPSFAVGPELQRASRRSKQRQVGATENSRRGGRAGEKIRLFLRQSVIEALKRGRRARGSRRAAQVAQARESKNLHTSTKVLVFFWEWREGGGERQGEKESFEAKRERL